MGKSTLVVPILLLYTDPIEFLSYVVAYSDHECRNVYGPNKDNLHVPLAGFKIQLCN